MHEDEPKVIAGSDIFSIVASWGRRAEPAEVLAARLIAMVERLRVLHPEFARWLQIDEHNEVVPFDLQPDTQKRRVTGNMSRRPSGELVPEAGITLVLASDIGPKSDEFILTGRIGADHEYCSGNYLHLGSHIFAAPVPELVSYDVFRGALLAMAEAFDVTQVYAYPHDLQDLWLDPRNRSGRVPLAWMCYVAPRFAPLVSPPASVIVECRPNGGLFMAAADETFRTAIPEHMARARDIEAALDRYNAEAGKRESGK